MTIFFTSDQHFGHKNVIEYCSRPYRDVTEMNEALIDNWNLLIQPDDIVYILGDFSLSFTEAAKAAPNLNGKKFLIPGNHDHCHPMHRKARKLEACLTRIKEYASIGLEVLVIADGSPLLQVPFSDDIHLCHLPYHDQKFAKYAPQDRGRWLLCGHVHEKWKTKDRMINVGVDVWNYAPVSLETIQKFMQDLKG